MACSRTPPGELVHPVPAIQASVLLYAARSRSDSSSISRVKRMWRPMRRHGIDHDTVEPRALRLDNPLLKPEQAAQLLAVRTSWIYEAVRTNRL